MKVHVEDISLVKKKVHVEIPEERVVKEIDSFYEGLRKKARIKGFRPGKVPRNILERHFKEYAKGEVLQKLIQDTYPEVLSEATILPVSHPVFDPQELENGKPFRYSAVVEIKPDFKVEKYEGLVLKGEKEEVRAEEIEERLKGLQNLHAQLKTVSESRPVQAGDYVTLDYQANMGGQPLEEGKGTDATVEVGSGRFIPSLEEKLVGMKPEDGNVIPISFPEDYGYKKWAGKTIDFQVKIKEIKEKVLPLLDDEFAKDLGAYDSLEALKVKLREDIEREKEAALDHHLKDQIVDHLLNANSFEIPPSMVEEQTQALVSDAKLRLSSQGLALADVGLSEEKLREDYAEAAQKQVKTFLILEKIATQEGITATDEEAENRLREISERSNQKFDLVKRYYEKNGLIPELKGRILADKTLTLLLQKSTIT
jgi:trigger factor